MGGDEGGGSGKNPWMDQKRRAMGADAETGETSLKPWRPSLSARTRKDGAPSHPLFAWSEVAFPGSRQVAAIVAIKVDRAERSVGLEVGRRIGERVLAPKLFLDVVKAVGDFLNRGRKEDPAAGLRRQLG